eukprot:763177-Hanusia_phi.AAC.1
MATCKFISEVQESVLTELLRLPSLRRGFPAGHCSFGSGQCRFEQCGSSGAGDGPGVVTVRMQRAPPGLLRGGGRIGWHCGFTVGRRMVG